MGKNKEKVLDVKDRVKKISEEHLKEIQQTVNKLNGLQFNIGKIETQKHMQLAEFKVTQDLIAELQMKLQKEYGTFDVNLEDGTINWPNNGRDTFLDNEK
mgnify:CR=1 FL=1|tara:strand:- start:175 stop:474 length:300 start_codon:yes stop_codon:yes gene_type:complete